MERVRFLRKPSSGARVNRREKEVNKRQFKTEEEKHAFTAGFNVGFNNGMDYINESVKKGIYDLTPNGICKPKRFKGVR